MHVYVTGACGMLGSHLTDRLLSDGHTVTLIDNLSRGKNFPQSKWGIWDTCLCDLTCKCPDFEPDSVVFHLAAKVAGIEYNRTHHYDMQMTNAAINHNVLEAVRRSKPRLFAVASTVCIYGSDVPIPTPESCGDIGNPERSNWGYGVEKWAMEQAARSLCLEHGIPTIVVRPSNMAGLLDYYDEESSHVIPALIKRIMDGENPVVVWGTGNQTRSFLDPKDAAKALAKLMDWGLDFRPKNPCIFNIGHSREVSIADLVEMLISICVQEGYIPHAPRVVFDVTKPDGYKRRGSDVSALQATIGWAPDRPLADTLREMVQEYHARFQTG